MNLQQRLLEFIQQNNLLKKNEKVVVGFSGGADSTCLLHLLHKSRYEVIAAHLNHMQRTEANAEERFCEEQAKKLDIRFVSERVDVPKIAKDKKIGIEEAGRIARYNFFRKVHEQFGAKVATAHTLDDHIETIFLHLARGSGLTGVSGIRVQRDFMIRPLLWARREETHAFCEKEKLPILSDPANVEEAYARVRVRKFLIPVWESLHPSAVENLARFANIAREEDFYFDFQALELLRECEVEPHPELAFIYRNAERTFDLCKLCSHPHVLLRRAIRVLVHQFGREISYELAEHVLAAILHKRKQSTTLEGGDVVLETSPRQFRIRKLEEPPKFCKVIPIPGEVAFERWKIIAKEPVTGTSPLETTISLSKVRGSLYCRPFQPGDRIRPAKVRHERKIQDVLTDAKVGSALKKRLPLVYDEEGPLWVPGICTAARITPDESHEELLSLQLLPITPEEKV